MLVSGQQVNTSLHELCNRVCAQKCPLQDGWSAILLASVKGHAKVVSHLIAANANVNTPDKVCI